MKQTFNAFGAMLFLSVLMIPTVAHADPISAAIIGFMTLVVESAPAWAPNFLLSIAAPLAGTFLVSRIKRRK